MKWFKHDTDANMDAKLQEVMLDYGLEGYGLYWYCIELVAQNVNGDNLTFELEHDARIIARNTGSTPQKVEQMITSFINLGLLDAQNNHVFCLKLASRCDDFTAKAVRRKGVKPLINQQVGVSPTNSEKVPLEVEVRSKKKEEEIEVDRFSEFWDLYGKKKDTKRCKAKFKNLSKDSINKIFEVLPAYIASTPDIQYRKLPMTWLNGECWNDEIQGQLPSINSHLDFDQLVIDFNEAFQHKEFVPVAIKVPEADRNMINNIARELNLGNNGFKQYFEHCANSEQFDYVTNGVNMKAQGINYFLKEKTILQGIS